MMSTNNIDIYSTEYAISSYIDCYFCKIQITSSSVRCSIINKIQVISSLRNISIIHHNFNFF